MGENQSFLVASSIFHSFSPLLPIIMALFFFFPLRGGNFTIVSVSPLPIVPLCLLRCKDNHMLMMDSEWSSDFVFPILGMLRSDENRNLISKRLRAICEQNAEMLECLQKCPGSIENEILQMGLQPWEGICSNLRAYLKNSRELFAVLETQIGCWKQNIESITQECAFESQQLRHSTELLTRNVSVNLVETICEHLHHLSACFVMEYGKHCGTVSQRLVQSLFESSREVIAKMLQVKWADLPAKCQPNPEFAFPKLLPQLSQNSSVNFASSSNYFMKIHLLILFIPILINFFSFYLF